MGKKVLIVGNQETAARIKQELSGNFKIITCENEKEALDLLKKEKPFTLIVFGCKMAREIRERIKEQIPKGLNYGIITVIDDPLALEGILQEDPDDEIMPEELIESSLLTTVRFQSTRIT